MHVKRHSSSNSSHAATKLLLHPAWCENILLNTYTSFVPPLSHSDHPRVSMRQLIPARGQRAQKSTRVSGVRCSHQACILHLIGTCQRVDEFCPSRGAGVGWVAVGQTNQISSTFQSNHSVTERDTHDVDSFDVSSLYHHCMCLWRGSTYNRPRSGWYDHSRGEPLKGHRL